MEEIEGKREGAKGEEIQRRPGTNTFVFESAI